MAERPDKTNPIAEGQTLTRPSANGRPKIGVYICNCGGNIGDVVRCEQVARVLGSLPDVVVSHSHMFMCSDPGQKLITDDIKDNGVNRVVVGACSIFLHEQTFRDTLKSAGLNPYLYYHVGLREQDSWVHHHCPQEATEMAIRMMSAGIAKARLMEPLFPVRFLAERHALVIGAGVAGLRAALDIANRGLEVTLVEKSHFLGGHMAQWEHIFPTENNARTLLHDLIEEVTANPNITIHTGAQVVAVKGYVGDFEIRIRQQPRGISEKFSALEETLSICPVEVPDEFNFGLTTRKAIYRPYAGCYPSHPAIDWEHCTRCGECLEFSKNGDINLDEEPIEFDIIAGAVVVATGFRPYEPFPGEFGFGENPEVITLPQLERILAEDGPTGGRLEIDGHPIKSLALIHCVGSRQIDGLHKPQPDGNVNDYCSRVCCTATLSAANHIHERFPDITIYDIYEDIRTYGRGHEEYYQQASKNMVRFLRYFAEELPEVKKAANGSEHPLLVTVKDHLTWGEEIELPVDLVVLSTGMMPNPIEDLIDKFKINPGTDRFLQEVHPKLRPVETAVAGVVLAGTAQGPMNIQESCAAAEAAASKVAVLLGLGEIEMEPFVAQVDPARCNGTGECVDVCPQEDAVHLETFTENGQTKQRALVTPANCNGCGICVSVCPNGAINVQGWRLDEFEAMVEAIAADIPALEGAL